MARKAGQESPAITTHEGCAADADPENLRQSAQAADPAALESVDDARDRPRAVAVPGRGIEVRPCGARILRYVGGGAGAGRNGVGAAGICAAPPAPGADHHGAGLRLDPHGDEAPQARNATAVVGGISRDARPRGAALQCLLRAVSAVCEAVAALDAPASLRGR